MKEGLLIYGCYGYTGKLISEHAVEVGLKPILAGRDEEKTRALAEKLGLSWRVFDLDDESKVTENLRDFKVVLHCAGPFMFTSEVMAKACIKAKTHYLDITGEISVFEKIFRMDKAATEAGVLLMPGTGFDVVPTDCLALYLKEKLPTAESLAMALYQKGGKLSHGTAITVAENMAEGGAVRRNGKIEKSAAGSLTRVIDFGDKKRKTVAIPWGDVSTAYRSTGIPNITIYNYVPEAVIRSMKLSNYIGFILRMGFVKKAMKNAIRKQPAGPTDEMRKNAKGIIWGEVKGPNGKAHHALLELPEGYTLTAWTAVRIAQNIMTTEPPYGAKTPAQVFGKDFILQFDGVKRRDID
jgi:short subunit dehydrogenase-like uncharacterized protein